VRKEWAEDANTMAAQGWLPIKFPGRTKTTTVLGLVSLCGVTTRPFAMTHDRHFTPQPLQMQATAQILRDVPGKSILLSFARMLRSEERG
jgi:hypothetical protein